MEDAASYLPDVLKMAVGRHPVCTTNGADWLPDVLCNLFSLLLEICRGALAVAGRVLPRERKAAIRQHQPEAPRMIELCPVGLTSDVRGVYRHQVRRRLA